MQILHHGGTATVIWHEARMDPWASRVISIVQGRPVSLANFPWIWQEKPGQHDPADRRGFAALQQRQGHQTSIGFEPGVLKHGLRCMWDETWLQQVFTGDEVNQWNTPTKRPRTGDACARCSHTQVQRGKDLVAAGDHDIETFALMGGSTPPRSSQTRHVLI